MKLHLRLIRKAISRARVEIAILLVMGILFNVIYSTLFSIYVVKGW